MSTSHTKMLVETYRRPLAEPLQPIKTLFQRLKTRDRTAVTECMATYGSFLWAFAKTHSRTQHEAEILTEEIFQDIWRYAEREKFTDGLVSERTQVGQIAVRRLVRRKYEAQQIL